MTVKKETLLKKDNSPQYLNWSWGADIASSFFLVCLFLLLLFILHFFTPCFYNNDDDDNNNNNNNNNDHNNNNNNNNKPFFCFFTLKSLSPWHAHYLIFRLWSCDVKVTYKEIWLITLPKLQNVMSIMLTRLSGFDKAAISSCNVTQYFLFFCSVCPFLFACLFASLI